MIISFLGENGRIVKFSQKRGLSYDKMLQLKEEKVKICVIVDWKGESGITIRYDDVQWFCYSF